MAKIKYLDHRFGTDTMRVVEQARAICEDYARRGYSLTLRGLYYQLVSRALIPNNLQSYKRVGSIVDNARMAGLIDWDHLGDQTRELTAWTIRDSPADAIHEAWRTYQIDLWKDQRVHCEIWVEKDALSGIIRVPAGRNRVPFFACKGYTSQSAMQEAAQRLYRRQQEDSKDIVLIHLGDHDPSGIDMTRDITERLRLMIGGLGGDPIDVRRIALTWDQIEQYNPPPNPMKDTDSRSTGYEALYGNESWELDALDATVIDQLIQAEVESVRDGDLWDEMRAQERHEKALMRKTSDRWDDVAEFLDEGEDTDDD